MLVGACIFERFFAKIEKFKWVNLTVQIAQSELLELDQVREEYPVAKGVVESSINGSEIKNGNPNHSVNGIGGITFRNSVPGEKAIASIQGTERHLDNYCRNQKFIVLSS